mgnify:CR=1 FL=1
MAGLIPFNWRKHNLVNPETYDFNNMLEDFFNDDFPSIRNLQNESFKIDLQENEKEYIVEAELPGVDKENIDLTLEEGRLRIFIKKEENKEEKNKNYIHRERRWSSMERTILLSDVDDKALKAKLDNGILTINIPKKEKAEKAVKIEIL